MRNISVNMLVILLPRGESMIVIWDDPHIKDYTEPVLFIQYGLAKEMFDRRQKALTRIWPSYTRT